MGIDYAEYLHIPLWSDLQDILLSEEGKMEKNMFSMLLFKKVRRERI